MTIKNLFNFLNRKYGVEKETLMHNKDIIKGLNYDDICVGMKEESRWSNNPAITLMKVIDNLDHNDKYYR